MEPVKVALLEAVNAAMGCRPGVFNPHRCKTHPGWLWDDYGCGRAHEVAAEIARRIPQANQ